MIKIEIYEKVNGRVSETKELTEQGFKSFMYYFSVQCNTKDYDWRIVANENNLK